MPRLRITAGRLARWIRRRAPLADLLRLDDQDSQILSWAAERMIAAEAYAEAHKVYTLMMILWPQSGNSARLGEGVCLQLQGDLAGAERAYDRVLDADPDNVFALANRAEVRCLTDRNDQACADLARAASAIDRDGGPNDLRRRIERLGELAQAKSS